MILVPEKRSCTRVPFRGTGLPQVRFRFNPDQRARTFKSELHWPVVTKVLLLDQYKDSLISRREVDTYFNNGCTVTSIKTTLLHYQQRPSHGTSSRLMVKESTMLLIRMLDCPNRPKSSQIVQRSVWQTRQKTVCWSRCLVTRLHRIPWGN